MIRALRWLWLVLPPGWAVAAFFLPYLLYEALRLWMELRVFGTGPRFESDVLGPPTYLIVATCVAYGGFRAIAFHPLFRPEYCKWLELTRWTDRKPLPAGPIHLVVQDLVVIGLLLALMHTWGMAILQAILAFAFVYQLLLVIPLWVTGLRWRSYAILFVLGAAIWQSQNAAAVVTIVAALYPFTYLSLRRSLERFPWQLPDWWPRLEVKPDATREDRKPGRKYLGWPYDLLQPLRPRWRIRLCDGTAASVLLGWWVYAGLSHVSDFERDSPLPLAWFLIFGAIAWRAVLYCGNYWWPISLWGRLWTGRWIIPRYDRVLVAPILALAVLFFGPVVMRFLHVGIPLQAAVTVALIAWILMNMGPKLIVWQLTGGHRIHPGTADKRLFVKL